MPKEEGTVIDIVPEGALVRIKRTDACHGCPSAGICHMGGSGEREVLARNPFGARKGEMVEIEIKEGLLLKASFIIYMLPILGLLMGALFGRWIINFFGLPFNENTGAVLGGLTCLLVVFILIKIITGGSCYMKKYQPTITKVK
ncbi:MAG: SoxR reducing system RseC family protein [bacterium]